MNRLFDFECFTPPGLCEAALRIRLEERRKRRQIILLAFSGFLIQLALLLCGMLTVELSPAFAGFCAACVIVSTFGSGAIAVVFTQIRRSI